MTPQTFSIPYPFTCPVCSIEAPVYLRGTVPFLIPEKHCHHAIGAVRESGRVVVNFASDDIE